MTRQFALLAALALVFLFFAAPKASAQSASLQGIVSDESSGQVLTNAFVSLESGGVEVRSVLTDRNGLFLIGGIAPGSYTLRVRFLGYTEATRTGSSVRPVSSWTAPIWEGFPTCTASTSPSNAPSISPSEGWRPAAAR